MSRSISTTASGSMSARRSRTRRGGGSGIPDVTRRLKLLPVPRAWDLLSIALSVIAADISVRRDESEDGWTRQIELSVAVADTTFWTAQSGLVQELLRFLTND